MALHNLARMTTATTGTGTITLGSAVSGYLTFALAGVANGETVSYGIKDGANSEVGTGVYTSAGTTLTRSVTKSTNSDSAISLSGSAEVFITPRAEDLNPITSASATAFAVGPNGATNPTFHVDASAASAATGIKFTAAAAGSRASLVTISSGTNEGLSIDAKGTGTIRLGATSTGDIEFSRAAVPTSNDGVALGSSSLRWSDIYLASGAVLNFNGTSTIAHNNTLGLSFNVPNSRVMRILDDSAVFGTAGLLFDVTDGSNSIPFVAQGSEFQFRTGTTAKFYAIGTTASAANAFLDSGANNSLLRSTSSLKYKTDVRPISLDDALAVISKLVPIVYRSKAVADDPDREFFGLAAEDVAKLDPRLVNLNEAGEPDGVQYDRVHTLMIPVLQDLIRRVEAMEAALKAKTA